MAGSYRGTASRTVTYPREYNEIRIYLGFVLHDLATLAENLFTKSWKEVIIEIKFVREKFLLDVYTAAIE